MADEVAVQGQQYDRDYAQEIYEKKLKVRKLENAYRDAHFALPQLREEVKSSYDAVYPNIRRWLKGDRDYGVWGEWGNENGLNIFLSQNPTEATKFNVYQDKLKNLQNAENIIATTPATIKTEGDALEALERNQLAQDQAQRIANTAEQQRLQDEFDQKTRENLRQKYIPEIDAPAPQADKQQVLNAPIIPEEVPISTTTPPLLEKGLKLPFVPFDDNTDLVAGIVKEYNRLKQGYRSAVQSNDIKAARDIRDRLDILEPYIEPLLKTGEQYTKAFEEKNAPEVKRLEDQIYKLAGDQAQSKLMEVPVISTTMPLKPANSFTTAESVDIKPQGSYQEAGVDPRTQSIRENLLNKREKEAEAKGFFDKEPPILGPSNLRKAANEAALESISSKNISGNFNDVRSKLGNLYDEDRTTLYNNLGKTVGASPFDTMPAAEGSKLAAAAKRAQQAVTGHVEADAAADQILASKVEPVSSKPTITPQEHTVLEKYLNPYRETVVKDALADLDAQYNEKIRPAIFTELSVHPGLQHSGYKNYLLTKAKKDYEERRRKTINELGYKGFESAIAHVNEDRKLALEGLGTVGNQRLSALEQSASLPQKQALAENLDMNTVGNMASQEEALNQAAATSKYEHEKARQQYPLKVLSDTYNAYSNLAPAYTYETKANAPVAPRVSPGEMASQQAIGYGIQNLWGGKAAGGQITQDDDYYDRVRGLMNHYRSKEKPNATKEMLLNSIASMYSGPSKYVSDNVAANMPNALGAYNNAQNSEMDDEIKALELEMGMRKQQQADEDRILAQEDKRFHRNLEQQKLDFEREKSKAGYKPTVQQQLFNNKILKEGIDDAKGARDVLPKLKSLYDAFDKFDAESAKYTKAGDLVTSDFAKSLGSQRLMPAKQRSASQIIEKEKGQLAKAMFSHGLGQALAAKSEEELRKALPGDSLLPEARANVLKSLASEVSLKELKNMFNQKWKAINSDMTGADVAFNEYVDGIQPLDERGFLKQGVNKHMDELFKSLQGNQVQSNEYEPSMDEIAQEARERGLIQ